MYTDDNRRHTIGVPFSCSMDVRASYCWLCLQIHLGTRSEKPQIH